MAIGTSQAFRTQNFRLLGNFYDKDNWVGKKGYALSSDENGVHWEADQNETSGIFSGGIMTATIGGTTFNVSAGVGQVVSRTLDIPTGEVKTNTTRVSWNAQSNVSLTYRTTHQFSYFYIDENGAIQQQNSSFTDAEYKNKIILGTICHIDYATINLVTNKQNITYGDSHRLYELISTFGPIKRNGLAVSAYTNNLRLKRESGTVFLIGSNYTTDQFESDSISLNSANPALLCRVYRNGTGNFVFDVNGGSFYTNVDPTKYDNGSGTLQNVNNNQWTIQRLFFFPNNPNDIIAYYGVGIYNSYGDAVTAMATESFSEATITAENAVFLAYLVVRGGATDLSLVSDGKFFQSGAFRNIGAIGGGGGAGAIILDDLTDVAVTTPLDGQFLAYDGGTSLWKNSTLNAVNPLVFSGIGTSLTLSLNYATASQPGGVSTSAQTFGGVKTFASNVIVSGNLTVNGSTTTIDAQTLVVKDKNIELGVVASPTDLTADGGGITLKGTTDKTFNWIDATDSWTSSENLDLASGKSYKINGTNVLTSTALGSGVINSSLQSVGTLNNLTVAGYAYLATTSGNVGIGTTITNAKLDVAGGNIKLDNNSYLVSLNSNNSIYKLIGLSTNALYVGEWEGNYGSNLYLRGGNGSVFADFSQGNNQYFAVRGVASSTPTEYFRVTSSGNVGVGTTSPVQKLELYGVVGNPATSGTAQSGMMRFSNTTDNAVFDIGIRGGGNGAWLQSTDKTSLAANYALLLNPNGGNVGIGNSSPSNKLAVSGSVSVGSSYNVAGPTNGLLVEGNVGIGTTSPNGKLTIVGDGSANTYSGVLRIADSAADKWGGISLPDSQSVTTAANNYYLIGRGTAYSDRIMSFHIPNAATYGSGNQPKFGFYSSGTDLLASIEASTGTSYFKGNVGIGTTLPTYKLDVNGTSRFTGDLLSNGNITITKAGAYLYLNSTNSDAELLWMTNGGPRWAMGMNVGDATENLNIYNYTTATINFSILKSNGNVGIGSSNPAYKLDVSGTGRVGDAFFITTATTADAKIEIGAGRSGNGNSYIDLVGDATYTDYGLRLIRSNGGANTTSAIAHRGTGNLYITAIEAAAISLETSNTTRMTITSDGNVGIGTTAPSQKFEVVNGEIKAGRVDTGSEGGQVSFGRSTDNATAWYIDVYGSTSTPTLRFIDVSNASVRMTINESGNVGIGVASGTNLLDVNGTARIRSISASASAATIFLTTDANGVLISRTAAQVRSDIGAGTGSGTVTSVTGTAPIASSGGTTPAISLNDSGVTYAKIQNVSATARVLGRITAGAGVVEELTGANIATIIDTNAVTNSTNAANVTIATDDTTNSSYYLYFGANASGNTPLKASTKIRYNPSTGAFSATTKSFRIPHPTKPEHDLVYGSLESPYHGIRLTGKGKTNGTCAEIILPDYVNTLVDENTVNIQITSYKCAKVFYVENINIKDNKFVVKYDKSWYQKAKDVEFFWDFTAERKDVPKLVVEEKL